MSAFAEADSLALQSEVLSRKLTGFSLSDVERSYGGLLALGFSEPAEAGKRPRQATVVCLEGVVHHARAACDPYFGVVREIRCQFDTSTSQWHLEVMTQNAALSIMAAALCIFWSHLGQAIDTPSRD